MGIVGDWAVRAKAVLVAVCICTTGAWSQEERSDVPAAQLDLEGVLDLFSRSQNLEEFEKLLNSSDTRVNNLDLNGDGMVDYIRVFDRSKGDDHAIVLNVPINDDESQDVAVIELSKTGDETAGLQIVGDEAVFGKNYIVEPGSERSADAYETDPEIGREKSTSSHVTVNVYTWPVVSYVYSPRYSPWYSPWAWGYYPGWYVSWSPWAWHAWHWHWFHYSHHHHYYYHPRRRYYGPRNHYGRYRNTSASYASRRDRLISENKLRPLPSRGPAAGSSGRPASGARPATAPRPAPRPVRRPESRPAKVPVKGQQPARVPSSRPVRTPQKGQVPVRKEARPVRRPVSEPQRSGGYRPIERPVSPRPKPREINRPQMQRVPRPNTRPVNRPTGRPVSNPSKSPRMRRPTPRMNMSPVPRSMPRSVPRSMPRSVPRSGGGRR